MNVTFSEYEVTRYRPDREFLEGRLLERHGGTWGHARMLARLAGWFGRQEEVWGVVGVAALRIAVSEGRVRVPDVSLFLAGRLEVPLVAIEILSPDESELEVDERCSDLQRFGVENVWILDPLRRMGWRFVDGQRKTVERFEVTGTLVFLELSELWETWANPRSLIRGAKTLR